MDNPFIGVWIYPHYGKNSVVVRWAVEPQIADHALYSVYRSQDGSTPFVLISPEAGLPKAEHFVDEDFFSQDRASIPSYRVVAEIGDEVFDSPIVAAFPQPNRVEFGLYRQMLFALIYEMRNRRSGERVLVYKPIRRGETCACAARAGGGGSSICAECFGTGMKGGYYSPWVTYMCRDNVAPVEIQHTPDDASLENRSYSCTFLGIPEVWQGDLIVQPSSDERFELVKQTAVTSLKSVYPVSVTGALRPIRKDSVRYKVPLPPAFYDVPSLL